MTIGLIDVDGHHFPNLALMKISSYHKAQGDRVEWYNPLNRYDKVYLAKVFTFMPPAVDCDPPPTHIRKTNIISVTFIIDAGLTEAKPDDRGTNELKTDCTILS